MQLNARAAVIANSALLHSEHHRTHNTALQPSEYLRRKKSVVASDYQDDLFLTLVIG